MTVAQTIADYARGLFDTTVAGRLPDGGSLLILGLESTPERNLDEFWRSERNLDEFWRSGGGFRMDGFEKHFRPGLESLLAFIRGAGFAAETVGRCGYPRPGELNLKAAVVRAGLGRWGKNAVVLHPRYGTRLRFAAVRTDAPLTLPEKVPPEREENPACRRCSICIDACPVNALEPYRMPDASICLSNTTWTVKNQGRYIPCDLCLSLCPAGKKG